MCGEECKQQRSIQWIDTFLYSLQCLLCVCCWVSLNCCVAFLGAALVVVVVVVGCWQNVPIWHCVISHQHKFRLLLSLSLTLSLSLFFKMLIPNKCAYHQFEFFCIILEVISFLIAPLRLMRDSHLPFLFGQDGFSCTILACMIFIETNFLYRYESKRNSTSSSSIVCNVRPLWRSKF